WRPPCCASIATRNWRGGWARLAGGASRRISTSAAWSPPTNGCTPTPIRDRSRRTAMMIWTMALLLMALAATGGLWAWLRRRGVDPRLVAPLVVASARPAPRPEDEMHLL